MPWNNRFQHQEYRSAPHTSKFHLLHPEPPSHIQRADSAERESAVAACLRQARVAAIYLVHGTIVGGDGLGFLREIARVWPAAGDVLRRLQKQTLDNITRDTGNFTPEFARQLQDAVQGNSADAIPVRLFHWSSENHHIGRADGVVRLLVELAEQFQPTSPNHPPSLSPGDRILIWGHSHGGNVLALLTNLLANDADTNHRFFRAARSYYCWPGTQRIDMPVWSRAMQVLSDPSHPLRTAQLDLVTMGTPVRYGWDTQGCASLLHFINHRCRATLPDHVASFPPLKEDILQATGGDLIQQCAIAGTNFAPSRWAWRARRADRQLAQLLQPTMRKRDLLRRLKMGCRVHADGINLLVDYKAGEGNIAEHVAGHAVYTRIPWIPFHLEAIAKHAFGLQLDP